MKILFVLVCTWAVCAGQSRLLEKIDKAALAIYPKDADFDMNTLSEQDKLLFGRLFVISTLQLWRNECQRAAGRGFNGLLFQTPHVPTIPKRGEATAHRSFHDTRWPDCLVWTQ